MQKIATVEGTKAVISKYPFAFQKKFGQNFLIDAITYSISRYFPQVISFESIPDSDIDNLFI